MKLKHIKTSEIVDAFIFKDTITGKMMAIYWLSGVNKGKGGWVTTKVSMLCPIEHETDNEKHSKECQKTINERNAMYTNMFNHECEEYKKRIDDALEYAYRFGGNDEAHHLHWILDQMVRCLTKDDYKTWVKNYEEEDEDPHAYEWDCGIAP